MYSFNKGLVRTSVILNEHRFQRAKYLNMGGVRWRWVRGQRMMRREGAVGVAGAAAVRGALSGHNRLRCRGRVRVRLAAETPAVRVLVPNSASSQGCATNVNMGALEQNKYGWQIRSKLLYETHVIKINEVISTF